MQGWSLNVTSFYNGLGPIIVMPILVFILALLFSVKPGKAFRSSLTVGVSLIGIFAIIGLLISMLDPFVGSGTGRHDVIDLGWSPLTFVTWASPFAPIVIGMTVLINLVMIKFNLTKTFNVDVWNYWHFAFAGILVYHGTNSVVLGLLAASFASIVLLKLADWTAPMVHKHFNVPGVSITTLSSVIFFPVGWLGNKIIDWIPGLRNWDLTPQSIQKRLGFFGEPYIVGLLMGLLLGIVTGSDVKGILTVGLTCSALMFLMPRVVKFLMEGLTPITEAVREKYKKRYPDRKDIYIGLDVSVAAGNPTVITTALILLPLFIIVAFIMPGNRVFPLGDLANLTTLIAMVVLASKGNMFRSLLIGIPILIADLYIAAQMAPVLTNMLRNTQVDVHVPSDDLLLTSALDGGNPFRYWIYYLFQGDLIALSLIPVIGLLLFWLVKDLRR
ncbi:PTS galactitol transporter subunit IIC [Paenibacillus alkaliterrae]|uniref:PTS galactitol transporter subunit IIC n=1 Tax=Paenibacillus alkaliterrae TaxID=320909 RepID=UPI001F385964|nr:PTS transporter subunit IIC [Paenibacillus alkaliterrae]MCF2941622.1 PTS galactitol transporter subunit IIC [Paenibacillus alkaliterrae]